MHRLSLFIWNILIALGLFFIWAHKIQAADVIITEIMYNPEGVDDSHEWVEFYNNGNENIILIGGRSSNSWRFYDGKNHLLNIETETIPPGQYFILADDAQTFFADHPNFKGIVIDTLMNLKNTSATLKLIDGEGVELTSITYQNSWGANGNGKSLEKIDIQGDNSASNWQESLLVGGTPGVQNSLCISNSPTTSPEPETEPPQQESEPTGQPDLESELEPTSSQEGTEQISNHSTEKDQSQLESEFQPELEPKSQPESQSEFQSEPELESSQPKSQAKPKPQPQFESELFKSEIDPKSEQLANKQELKSDKIDKEENYSLNQARPFLKKEQKQVEKLLNPNSNTEERFTELNTKFSSSVLPNKPDISADISKQIYWEPNKTKLILTMFSVIILSLLSGLALVFYRKSIL